METTRISAANQAEIPADVRAALGVGPGDAIVWSMVDGEVRITKADPLDSLFLDVMVPTPAGYTPEGAMQAWRVMDPDEKLRRLREAIEEGRNSGVSERSFDDIVEACLSKNG